MEKKELIEDADFFHFGTLSMTDEGCKKATKAAVLLAKENGAVISFDPNYREPLWKSKEDALIAMEFGFEKCDVLKISDNEVEFFTGETDYDKGAAKLLEEYPDLKLVNITAGADGSYSYCCGRRVFVPSFRLGGTIETTGAGDTFCASVLHDVLLHGLEERSEESLRAMLRFANAAAYLVTTRRGAIRSMPEPDEIEKILINN